MENLVKMMAEAGIKLPPEQSKALWTYHNLLRTRNEDRELTRIINFEAMVIKHYVDCMIVGDLYRLPSPLMDLGSGAGFPGVPLKIRYPNLHLVLAEPRPKRVAFLNEVIEKLKLKNTKVFEHKVVSRSFTEPIDGVISRAVEEIPKTLLRCLGAAKPGTKIIFMKGPNCKDEMREAKDRPGNFYELVFDKPYSLPGTEHDRRLVVYERTDVPYSPKGQEESRGEDSE
jgi:16S rRNA (guanine(527)-N(7))-methyltransferase RsmG